MRLILSALLVAVTNAFSADVTEFVYRRDLIGLDAAVTFPKRSELQGRTPLPVEIPIAKAPGTGGSHPEISEHPPDTIHLSGRAGSGPGSGSSRSSGGSPKPNNSDDDSGGRSGTADPPPAEDENHGNDSENDKDPEKPENDQKPEKPENDQKPENSDGQDDPDHPYRPGDPLSSQHGGNASYTPLPPTPSTLSTNTSTTVRSTVLTSTEVLPTPTQVSLTPTAVSSTALQTPFSVASGLRIDTLPVSFIVIFTVLVQCWTSLFFI